MKNKYILAVIFLLFTQCVFSADIKFTEEEEKAIDERIKEMKKGRNIIVVNTKDEPHEEEQSKYNFSEEIIVEGEKVYAEIDGVKIKLFDRLGEKKHIILSPNKEMVAYFDKKDQIVPKKGNLEYFTVWTMKLSGKGAKKHIVKNLTDRIEDIIWITDKEFLVKGYSFGSNENAVFTMFKINKKKEMMYFPARSIAISPDKRFICMLRYMPRMGMPEEYMSDYVDVLDLKARKMFVAYPFENGEEKKFENLKERYDVSWKFVWASNTDVYFVCNHNESGYLVSLKYDKSADRFAINEKKMENYFVWVKEFNLLGDRFEIKGKIRNSSTSADEDAVEMVLF
ncbi:MAG: hypothetical protein CVV21_04685 [Candidatus Goldiibacteriota bacterium HGW-Goldbacteria-1]|nr:MAG: hypothetical protein CVV21_04685 [Candidatus Goldiibacteriota bacterium HGW-Goldbacteria-1]